MFFLSFSVILEYIFVINFDFLLGGFNCNVIGILVKIGVFRLLIISFLNVNFCFLWLKVSWVLLDIWSGDNLLVWWVYCEEGVIIVCRLLVIFDWIMLLVVLLLMVIWIEWCVRNVLMCGDWWICILEIEVFWGNDIFFLLLYWLLFVFIICFVLVKYILLFWGRYE